MWQRILQSLYPAAKTHSRKHRKRSLRLETMERRQLLVANLGVIEGNAFVDQNSNGVLDAGEPAVLVDNNGDLVAPGTPGAQGIDIELFFDTNGDDTFDVNDQNVGSIPSNIDGSYRFDGLTALGTYFLRQAAVPQLTTPSVVSVEVLDVDGVRTQLIDDYAQTSQTVVASANSTASDSDTASTANVIGGARDITVIETNNGGAITLNLDAPNAELTIGAQGTAVGTALIQYDGDDANTARTLNGLGNAPLAGGVAGEVPDVDAGLVVFVGAQLTPTTGVDTLTITVFSPDGSSSETVIDIDGNPSIVEKFVRFSAFTPVSGGGADFNDIGVIEAQLTISEQNDITVSIVEAITPVITSASIPSVQPVTLGGEIFIDNSAGGQNNGVRDLSEVGVASAVTVELYQLANPTDVVDPATQTPIATAQTGANGAYSFAGLVPGNYAVVVPADQFDVPGQRLFGFASSTGNTVTDPDDNVDGDDSGTMLANGDVISGTITLESNLEPINDADTDPNTNTTLDFGFFPQVDLAITKTVNVVDTNAAPGGNVVFDIVVENLGPLDATGVTVRDVFPAGLTYTGLANQGGLTQSISGTTVTVDVGTVVPGTPITFQMLADIGAAQTLDITNTAEVLVSDQVDSDPINNSSSDIVEIIETDLSITKSDADVTASAGGTLTYTITVNNAGPDDATGVVVRDTLPAGLSFSSGDVDGASNLVQVDGVTGEIVATIGNLANAANSVVTIVVDVAADANTPLTNSATVSLTPNTDPDLSNNTTTEDTPVDRIVDVGVIKNVTGTPVAGGNIVYEVIVENFGAGVARDVEVTDTLDADLTFVSFDAGTSAVTQSQTGQLLTFDVGTLNPGQQETFTFEVTIDSAATGSILNTAAITTSDIDNNAANDSESETVTVTRSVDLVLDKSVDLATAVPGQDSLVYTFVVSHDTQGATVSISDAIDVTVTDVLPSSVVGAVIDAPTATNTNFDNNTNTVTVDFDTIPLGETRSFTVTVTIPEAATGTVLNPASVASVGNELDATNNTDDASTTLSPEFDVEVRKAVDDNTPQIGSTVTYTVELENAGPSTATGVVLTDPVPTGLTFVSGSLDGTTGSLANGVVTFPAITIDDTEIVTATLTFTVDNDAPATITNTASIPDLSAAGEQDVTNNSDDIDVTVVPIVNLEIDKNVSVTNAVDGDSLVYTITVTNNGPSAAAGVQVTDTAPAGVIFDSGTDPVTSGTDVGDFDLTGGVVTVDVATLASGASFSFTINATVDGANVPGPNQANADSIVNPASVTSTTLETDATDNTDSATTTVDPVLGSIRGTNFADLNNNQVQDAGELGIGGVEITLTGTDVFGNTVNRSVTTSSDQATLGDYLFDQLAAGDYTITQPTQPAGFEEGTGVQGTGTGTSNVTTGTNSIDVTLDPRAEAVEFNITELAAAISKRRFLASANQGLRAV